MSNQPRSLVRAWALITACCWLAGACAVTRPTVKIGLAAPFEGRYRAVGYDVIYAVRLAVREANAAGGVAGYSLELVALDDSGDPEQAVTQARKLAVDPQIVAVLGHWLDVTTVAAAPEYARAGLPLLATAAGPLPDGVYRLWPAGACHLASGAGCVEALEDLRLRAAEGVTVTVPAPLPVDSRDPGFAERYQAISNGVAPGFNAVLAYDAARVLIDALARDLAANKTPTRAGVGAALSTSAWLGLSGQISFDAAAQWTAPPAWTYRWEAGTLARP